MREGIAFSFAVWAWIAVGVQHARADGFGSSQAPLVVPLAQLPNGALPGTVAYVTDCRAIVSVSGLALVLQAAGAGSGCLATFNGAKWQIDGTTISVTN